MAYAKDDPGAAAFIRELVDLCRKHGVVLSHEDGEGSFIVEKAVNEAHVLHHERWLSDAFYEARPQWKGSGGDKG